MGCGPLRAPADTATQELIKDHFRLRRVQPSGETQRDLWQIVAWLRSDYHGALASYTDQVTEAYLAQLQANGYSLEQALCRFIDLLTRVQAFARLGVHNVAEGAP